MSQLEIVGKVDCPDKKRRPNSREIRIGKKDTDKLPLNRFPICPRISPCAGTAIKLIAGGEGYNTRLHRYESGCYIANAKRDMRLDLKDFLQRHGGANQGRTVVLKVQGYNFLL